MQAKAYCVVCILNQVLRVADHLNLDEEQKNLIMQRSLEKAAEIQFTDFTAPQYSEMFYQIAAEVSGNPDPYKELRRQQNHMVMDAVPLFQEKIEAAKDPLLTAGYFALLGNIIDYGGVQIFNTDDIFKKCDHINITINDYPQFKDRLANAKKVLILSDNAGEAVFDKLFIQQMKHHNPNAEIFYGVRSKPAINDIIMEDALYIGIDQVATLIETGASCAGTIVPEAPQDFKDIYYNADIIISKGQGNYETLEPQPENILYIFKVKCDIVSKFSNLKLGSLIFAFGDRLKEIASSKA